MVRELNRLSARRAATVTDKGYYADGVAWTFRGFYPRFRGQLRGQLSDVQSICGTAHEHCAMVRTGRYAQMGGSEPNDT